ncbi:hypothetical protein D3C80_1719530 [compost metagenome]
MAPAPERNLIQLASPCNTAMPNTAPMISCAMVPTTISESAVAIRKKIDSNVATKARPSHKAACAHISVMTATVHGRVILARNTEPDRALHIHQPHLLVGQAREEALHFVYGNASDKLTRR